PRDRMIAVARSRPRNRPRIGRGETHQYRNGVRCRAATRTVACLDLVCICAVGARIRSTVGGPALPTPPTAVRELADSVRRCSRGLVPGNGVAAGRVRVVAIDRIDIY